VIALAAVIISFTAVMVNQSLVEAGNEKTGDLRARLGNAHNTLTNMMIEQDKDIPLFMSYVDEKTNTLVVGIDEKASGSPEEYKAKLAAMFGENLRLRIVIGHFEET